MGDVAPTLLPTHLASGTRDVALMLMLKKLRPLFSELRDLLRRNGSPHRTGVDLSLHGEGQAANDEGKRDRLLTQKLVQTA